MLLRYGKGSRPNYGYKTFKTGSRREQPGGPRRILTKLGQPDRSRGADVKFLFPARGSGYTEIVASGINVLNFNHNIQS